MVTFLLPQEKSLGAARPGHPDEPHLAERGGAGRDGRGQMGPGDYQNQAAARLNRLSSSLFLKIGPSTHVVCLMSSWVFRVWLSLTVAWPMEFFGCKGRQ